MKKEPAHTQALEVFVSSTEELLMALIPFFFSVDSAHHLSVPTLFIVESNINLTNHIIMSSCFITW